MYVSQNHQILYEQILSCSGHTSEHELISVVRDREDVGWSLHTLLASVGRDYFSIVHWEPLVGVHSCTEQPRVGLKEIIDILS